MRRLHRSGLRATRPVGRDVNLGSGKEISIGDLAARLVDLAGSTATIVCEDHRHRPPKSEVERLIADTTLARRLIGWAPEVSLRDGLTRTHEWFREHPDQTQRRLTYVV